VFITSRVNPTRVLIFNCTHGRSGTSFLESVLAKVATQLQLHGSAEVPHAFFDKVVFCTNVTYADGRFKGGKIGSLLYFTMALVSLTLDIFLRLDCRLCF
jgi:folylpolyglutamate synthase